MDDQCKYNTYTCFIYNQLWFKSFIFNILQSQINSIMLTNSIQFCNSIQLCKSIISNQFNYSNQFSYANQLSQINSIMPINSIMLLTNLTYVFDMQDIRVTGTVPLGYKPVSNSFITQYGPAGLLTGYKQSISEHFRYGPAGLLIGVTHQYNNSQYCYLTPIGIPIYP